MEKYNFDDKGGLFAMKVKKPSKILSKEEHVSMMHFNYPKLFKMKIESFDDTSVVLEPAEDIPDLNFSQDDHVVLNYFADNTSYVMPGHIVGLEPGDSCRVTVSIRRVRKGRDMIKQQKKYVSYGGKLSPHDRWDRKDDMVIEAVCPKGIRVYSPGEYGVGDTVEVFAPVGDLGKLSYRGRIARKDRMNSQNRYVIEIDQITESNARLLNAITLESEL